MGMQAVALCADISGASAVCQEVKAAQNSRHSEDIRAKRYSLHSHAKHGNEKTCKTQAEIIRKNNMDSAVQRKGPKVHTRNIEIATYSCDDGYVIVEGMLTDEHLIAVYSARKGKTPPDTIHHMVLRLLVQIPSLIIKDVEVELFRTPHEECPDTISSLDKIKGMKVAPGFTAQVKKILGGTKGCAHLTALLLAMAPAVVQGSWVHITRKPPEKDFSSGLVQQFLVDTCHVWRKDGPLAKRVLKRD